MRKVVDLWRNLRLQTKFLLIQMLAILLVSITAMVALRIPMSSYDEQLYRSSSQMVSLFASQIQTELQGYESISYRILTDSALQKNLVAMNENAPGTVAWTAAQKEVADCAAYFSLWFSDIVSFQLKTNGGRTYCHYRNTNFHDDGLTPERIELAAEQKGRCVWLIEDGEEPSLMLLRTIREMDPLNLNPLATILVEVDFSSLVENYRSGMSQMGTPLQCAVYSGDVCLYASDENIRTLAAGENGYEHMRLNGQDVLCVRYTGENGMQYVTLIDYSKIKATTFVSVHLVAAVILAATTLALLISTVLSGSILRHLQILLNKFDDFTATGKPVPESDDRYISRRDELGRLHRHFDRMTREWDRIVHEREEQQRLLQERQIQQLRAQVRPHFLYNTLESIYVLAQSSGNQRIAVMSHALGKMLRASLDDKKELITVEEDLQITRDYLSIQLLRFEDRLRVEYDVPKELLPCMIPSMTIQPLVENAVHHAAEEMLNTCVIRIGGRAAADHIEIFIEDNGPGMDEDVLEKLESGEVKPDGLGIGMRNINKRIQYAFAGQYGLQVRRTCGRTQVIVCLPDTRRNKSRTAPEEGKGGQDVSPAAGR